MLTFNNKGTYTVTDYALVLAHIAKKAYEEALEKAQALAEINDANDTSNLADLTTALSLPATYITNTGSFIPGVQIVRNGDDVTITQSYPSETARAGDIVVASGSVTSDDTVTWNYVGDFMDGEGQTITMSELTSSLIQSSSTNEFVNRLANMIASNNQLTMEQFSASFSDITPTMSGDVQAIYSDLTAMGPAFSSKSALEYFSSFYDNLVSANRENSAHKLKFNDRDYTVKRIAPGVLLGALKTAAQVTGQILLFTGNAIAMIIGGVFNAASWVVDTISAFDKDVSTADIDTTSVSEFYAAPIAAGQVSIDYNRNPVLYSNVFTDGIAKVNFGCFSIFLWVTAKNQQSGPVNYEVYMLPSAVNVYPDQTHRIPGSGETWTGGIVNTTTSVLHIPTQVDSYTYHTWPKVITGSDTSGSAFYNLASALRVNDTVFRPIMGDVAYAGSTVEVDQWAINACERSVLQIIPMLCAIHRSMSPDFWLSPFQQIADPLFEADDLSGAVTVLSNFYQMYLHPELTYFNRSWNEVHTWDVFQNRIVHALAICFEELSVVTRVLNHQWATGTYRLDGFDILYTEIPAFTSKANPFITPPDYTPKSAINAFIIAGAVVAAVAGTVIVARMAFRPKLQRLQGRLLSKAQTARQAMIDNPSDASAREYLRASRKYNAFATVLGFGRLNADSGLVTTVNATEQNGFTLEALSDRIAAEDVSLATIYQLISGVTPV